MKKKWIPLINGLWYLFPMAYGFYTKMGWICWNALIALILYGLLLFMINKYDSKWIDRPIVTWTLFFMGLLNFLSILIPIALKKSIEWNYAMALSALIGLLFILIGNWLPKLELNPMIGIRTTWTLQNEANWNYTQRYSGYLWIICGCGMMISSLFPRPWIGLFLFSLIAGIGSILISYIYYRIQKQKGEEWVKVKSNKKWTIISFVSLSLILGFCLIVLFIGDYKVELTKDNLLIDANLVSDANIPLASIQSIEYVTEAETGDKIFGYGTSRLKMGNYANKEWGNYIRYTKTIPAYILIKTNDTIYVINEETVEKTQTLYEQIQKQHKKEMRTKNG